MHMPGVVMLSVIKTSVVALAKRVVFEIELKNSVYF
jgi:hypothetical protein